MTNDAGMTEERRFSTIPYSPFGIRGRSRGANI